MRFRRVRPRRLRAGATLRRMVRETRLAPDQLVLPLFAVTGTGVEQPIAALPGQSRQSPDVLAKRARAAFDAGVPAVLLFGVPDEKDAAGSSAYADRRRGPDRDRRDQGRRTRPRGDHRRVPVRVHRPWPLRRDRGRPGAQRPQHRADRQDRGEPRRRRRRHRLPERHDGRPRRRDPLRARRREPRGDGHPLLRRQVRLGVLRAVPRGGRLRPGVRRPPRVPDGPRECPRGASRGRTGRGRGRRHDHGQAGRHVPRRDHPPCGGPRPCRSPRTT